MCRVSDAGHDDASQRYTAAGVRKAAKERTRGRWCSGRCRGLGYGDLADGRKRCDAKRARCGWRCDDATGRQAAAADVMVGTAHELWRLQARVDGRMAQLSERDALPVEEPAAMARSTRRRRNPVIGGS